VGALPRPEARRADPRARPGHRHARPPCRAQPAATRPHPISGTVGRLMGLGGLGRPLRRRRAHREIGYDDGPPAPSTGRSVSRTWTRRHRRRRPLPDHRLSIGNAPPEIARGSAARTTTGLRDYCRRGPEASDRHRAVPMIDVDAAVAEARRCVRELGFRASSSARTPTAAATSTTAATTRSGSGARWGSPSASTRLAMWDMPGDARLRLPRHQLRPPRRASPSTRW